MTPNAMRIAVADAYGTLDRICNLASYCGPERAQELFRRASETSLQVERSHRGFGRRFTNGQAGYRVSAECAARYFVVKHVVKGLGRLKRPDSWAHAVSVREDVAVCYAIAESIKLALKSAHERSYGRDITEDRAKLRKLVRALKKHAALKIDYAQDMAA